MHLFSNYSILTLKKFSLKSPNMKKITPTKLKCTIVLLCLSLATTTTLQAKTSVRSAGNVNRQRISINAGWRFYKYDSLAKADNLIYDVRPEVSGSNEYKVADAKPTEAVEVKATQEVLKTWILPSANGFINDLQKKHIRPAGNPGGNFPFVQGNFDDNSWEKVDLPHDWAIKGPFMSSSNPEVGGGMGRLQSNGIAWYRRKLDIPVSDAGKSIFLDVDGAMSYAMVWLNGILVGGWPYGYNSWRLDLTPYIIPGGKNQLAIRLDNPNNSARWYPGGGIYRNVWLTKTSPIHVGQYGTYITTKNVSKNSATLNLEVTVDNNSKTNANVSIVTHIFALNSAGKPGDDTVAQVTTENTKIATGKNTKISNTVTIQNPKLWGPWPTQTPNLYLAVTSVSQKGKIVDTYETRFGIRSLEFNPDKGLFVNGEHVQIKGVNQHHDLGSLGTAFNIRAAERQLEILREMGCNAIRMSHNPPAPELLELTDRMGFLVINEIFDSWELKKTALDFHLIFSEWSEPDARSFVRRDRNYPSVIMWSFGNEVGEQYTGEEGAKVAKRIHDIIKEEDTTRPTISAMNYAKPDMPLPAVLDVIGLNYQGEGIRQSPEFEGTDRIRTAPQYDAYHARFPDKVILSTETASAFSSRGIYLFPVSKEVSAPVRDGRGGDSKTHQVSAYELHAVDFGSSADKVFSSLDQHPFVAGEFVWTGWDHLGEPTPYYESRSAYCGMIDLAGFKKDRFYLYQSHWRPDFPMTHILPHWNWAERIGEITPVHVFTSGDEAELFLNGKSLGKKKKVQYEYRLRWDTVRYEPGELKVIAYKNGKQWAESSVKTTGTATRLMASADREIVNSDGKDLAFITVQVTDKDGLVVPRSNQPIDFSIDGPGEIVATDNGDATNMVSFASKERDAFNGLCLVIIRSKAGEKGTISVTAKSSGLKETIVKLQSK
jgi:beta-galactosidase